MSLPRLYGRYAPAVTPTLLYKPMRICRSDDVFGIAAMYAVAIARGHIFNDANKRTALVASLTYLMLQEIDVERNARLEDDLVHVAEGKLDVQESANILASLALGFDDFDVIFPGDGGASQR